MTAKEFSQNFGESTIKVIILGVVTFGIYFFIWIAERRKELNTLAEQEIFNNNLLIAAAICSGMSTFLSTIQIALTGNTGSSNMFSLGYSILMIIISWKIGKWFELYCTKEFKIDLKVNKFLLVFFNIFYLNYLFNTLSVRVEK
jgi:hypothetical protein